MYQYLAWALGIQDIRPIGEADVRLKSEYSHLTRILSSMAKKTITEGAIDYQVAFALTDQTKFNERQMTQYIANKGAAWNAGFITPKLARINLKSISVVTVRKKKIKVEAEPRSPTPRININTN
jgi:hypothetical protein